MVRLCMSCNVLDIGALNFFCLGIVRCLIADQVVTILSREDCLGFFAKWYVGIDWDVDVFYII